LIELNLAHLFPPIDFEKADGGDRSREQE
jgi:hypothetical protein